MRRGIAALAILLAAAQPRPIAIVINGSALSLDPPPRFEHSVLLVPVRRTIEALGLPFDRSGNSITTLVGSKTITVTVGDPNAQIDRRQVTLETPPIEIDYVLYVPLRFFTDVLGAQARFDRKSNSVTIVSQLIGRSSNGFVSTGNGYQRFGTVAAVDVLSDPPTLTLEFNGGTKTIKIAPNATIDVEDVDVNVTSPGELGDVRPGDFAMVEMRKDGRVERVVDEYGSRNGQIVAIAGDEFVLADGQVIAPGRTAEISLNGKASSLSDLRANDEVTVRYNVESNEVREILASRSLTTGASASGAVAIGDVSSDANHPLRPGETIHVTMHGTAGAAASFDLGSDVIDQIMLQRTPGVYVGSYTLPRGVNFNDVAVIGRLTVGNVTAEAPALQTVSASSIGPGISDVAPDAGVTINSRQPAVYASFAADAVPVDPGSALLWLNGRDVTSECVRTGQFIQYLPQFAYPDGPVHATVRVSDRAGNTTVKSWTFWIRTH